MLGCRPAIVRAAAIALLCLCAALASAQDTDDIDYAAWDQVVERVDRVLDAGRATEATLDDLRVEVTRFRERFLAAETANANRLDRLRSQLDALGPPPDTEAGESEPPEVAERRAELNNRIEDLAAPGIRARAAFAEADSLVAEIDAELRLRRADRILNRYPTPLNPLNWTEPLNDLRDLALTLPSEILAKIRDPEPRAAILRNIPPAMLSLIAGILMVFRTRVWTDRLASRIEAIRARRLRRGLRLLNTTAELGLPLAGLGLLLGAIQLTGLPGEVGTAVLVSLYAFGGALVVGTWLVREFFPRHGGETSPLRIAPEYVPAARRASFFLVFFLALEGGLRVLGEQLNYSGMSGAFIAFAVSLAIAYFVHRVARLFRKSVTRGGDGAKGETAFSDGVIAVVATLASVASLAAPLVGFAGYVSLTNNIVTPLAQSYLLFGFLALAQKAVAGFVQLLRAEDSADGEEGLIPTLVGILLILAAMPVFALIWGARVTDITEVWQRFREGFTLGDVTIAPGEVLAFIVVFAVGYTVTQLVQGALKHSVLPKTRLEKGAQTALVSGVGYIGIFLAAVIAITTAGINLSNLAIFASALAVGIGFGLQTIVSNFVSGIILLIERPVSEGDWIEVGGQMGYVRRISVRATRIETFDRTDVIVPNADLVSGVVTNWTRGNSVGRVIVPVGVAYGTDTRKVERILDEVANAHPLVILTPPPSILFMGFGDSSLNFEIRAILRDVNWVLSVRSEMNHDIARRFAEEGIEIPFPQRDVWLRGREGGAADPAAPEKAQTPPPRRDAPEDPRDDAGAEDGDGGR